MQTVFVGDARIAEGQVLREEPTVHKEKLKMFE
jgi:hypothetical protein